jgi:hypothetical protein
MKDAGPFVADDDVLGGDRGGCPVSELADLASSLSFHAALAQSLGAARAYILMEARPSC